MEIFNNREIATAVWLAILAILAFSNKSIRAPLRPVVDAFTNRHILIPFGLLALYTLVSIWLLNCIGLWESHQVKNAILWFIATATVSLMRIPETSDDRDYFKQAIADNLKIIVFLQFLINFYSFNLFFELLFFPFMALLGCLLAFTETDEKYFLVRKILNKLAEIVGLLIIVYAAYKLITTFDEFAQKQTFYDFITPISLSFLLLPFIYLLHVYMVYERIFIKMKFFINDDELRKYAKKSAIKNYLINISALRRWADAINYHRIRSTSDIDEINKEIKHSCAEEKNPSVVSFEHGWSPYNATKFLTKKGLKVGYYKKSCENDWFASSSYLNIGDDFSMNNIAYYLEGNREAVTQLKLKLNVSDLNQARVAHETLFELASKLHLDSLGAKIEERFNHAILNGKNEEICVNSKMVKVVIDHWTNNKGYDVQFSIKNS